MAARIRAVIVDDEPLAREGIRSLLTADPALRVIGECRDGVEAIQFLQRHPADLLFLDIQMPEVNGFEVLESINKPPVTIFVTAYDRYAVEAFSVHAFDYILKPVDHDRFAEALTRAKSTIFKNRQHIANAKLASLLSAMRAHQGRSERLIVRSYGKVHFIPIGEIDWIEAAGDYVYIHVNGRRFLHRETMRTLDRRLSSGTFCRIHRSTIVNAATVRELKPLAHGEAFLFLRDGTRLNVSRNYRQELLSRLS